MRSPMLAFSLFAAVGPTIVTAAPSSPKLGSGSFALAKDTGAVPSNPLSSLGDASNVANGASDSLGLGSGVLETAWYDVEGILISGFPTAPARSQGGNTAAPDNSGDQPTGDHHHGFPGQSSSNDGAVDGPARVPSDPHAAPARPTRRPTDSTSSSGSTTSTTDNGAVAIVPAAPAAPASPAGATADVGATPANGL